MGRTPKDLPCNPNVDEAGKAPKAIPAGYKPATTSAGPTPATGGSGSDSGETDKKPSPVPQPPSACSKNALCTDASPCCAGYGCGADTADGIHGCAECAWKDFGYHFTSDSCTSPAPAGPAPPTPTQPAPA